MDTIVSYDVQIKFRLFDHCTYIEDIKCGKQKLNSTWLLKTNLIGSHVSVKRVF